MSMIQWKVGCVRDLAGEKEILALNNRYSLP